MDTMYAELRQAFGELVDSVAYYQPESGPLLHPPHNNTIISPDANDSPYYPFPFPGFPMTRNPGLNNTGDSTLALSPAALLPQDGGSGSAPDSSTLFPMPGAPQILQDNSNTTSPTVDYFTPGAPQVSNPLPVPSQPDLPTFPSQTNITNPPVTATPGNPKQCPVCKLKFSRWQDRDRHISIHFPHWIHCPLPHCAWRSNRVKSIKQHWKRQDHLQYHESYGHTLRQEQFEIFDPQPLVNQIKAGTISASNAVFQALFSVDVKAAQLQKSSMSENPWGYKLKSAPLLILDPQ